VSNVEFNENIYTLEKDLRDICVKIKTKGREILSEFDITPPQFQALLYLVFEGDLTLGELSGRMYLACSTITDLLDRMEKSSLVKRIKDEKDKRVTRVMVLEKGTDLIEKVLYNRRKFLYDITKEFGDDKIDDITKYMTLLNENMEL